MSLKVAKRYAKACFDLSLEAEIVRRVYKDFTSIMSLIENSTEFHQFILDPTLARKAQKDVIKEVFIKKINPFTHTFLNFLVDQEKLGIIKEIIHSFEDLYLEHHQVLKVVITGAAKMNKIQIDEICSKLKKYYKKDIVPTFKEDASLIGGFKVQAGDRIYDYSVQAQFEEIKRSVMTA